ncbi:hypothetical protein BD410DRAFT_807926 [Rickenella mellea]|uniref:DUF6593 domain-containing protein n=1 Tax=Rickenella mellea TaxID=50990 RepID=A0A4Y7PNU2_9AGAM|nr:hypothetical protein BD410DRAFT_807926 [Rickenella mellea]
MVSPVILTFLVDGPLNTMLNLPDGTPAYYTDTPPDYEEYPTTKVHRFDNGTETLFATIEWRGCYGSNGFSADGPCMEIHGKKMKVEEWVVPCGGTQSRSCKFQEGGLDYEWKGGKGKTMELYTGSQTVVAILRPKKTGLLKKERKAHIEIDVSDTHADKTRLIDDIVVSCIIMREEDERRKTYGMQLGPLGSGSSGASMYAQASSRYGLGGGMMGVGGGGGF